MLRVMGFVTVKDTGRSLALAALVQFLLTMCTTMPLQVPRLSTAKLEPAESVSSLPPRRPSFSEQVLYGPAVWMTSNWVALMLVS